LQRDGDIHLQQGTDVMFFHADSAGIGGEGPHGGIMDPDEFFVVLFKKLHPDYLLQQYSMLFLHG
jgi:hypothetical protein